MSEKGHSNLASSLGFTFFGKGWEHGYRWLTSSVGGSGGSSEGGGPSSCSISSRDAFRGRECLAMFLGTGGGCLTGGGTVEDWFESGAVGLL